MRLSEMIYAPEPLEVDIRDHAVVFKTTNFSSSAARLIAVVMQSAQKAFTLSIDARALAQPGKL